MDSMPLDLRDKVHKDGKENNEKYTQIGTDEGELSPLVPIPLPQDRKSIHLKFVEIDPEVLMTSLRQCSKLESLELIDVDFTFTPTDVSASFRINPTLRSAINLPNLKTYKLRTGLNTEIGDYNRKEIFTSWIPFATPTPIEDLVKSSLHFDFFGKDDGTIFSINHEQGEIQSRLRWTNDILKSLSPTFVCKKLVVFFCYAELDVRILPSRSLVHLELTGTVFRHGTLSELLLRTPNIQTLYLDGVHNGKRSDDPGQISLHDLAAVSGLSSLWLDHMLLSYSPNVFLNQLRELVLDSRMENIEAAVIENFVTIFPNLESVALVMHNPLVNLLLEKLLGHYSIQKIFLKTQYIREKEGTWKLIESEELKSILLEINPEDDQYFVLTKVGQGWTGSPVDSYGPFLKEFLATPFVAFWD